MFDRNRYLKGELCQPIQCQPTQHPTNLKRSSLKRSSLKRSSLKRSSQVSIIISNGSLDGVYPGLIMANGARAEGIEANRVCPRFS